MIDGRAPGQCGANVPTHRARLGRLRSVRRGARNPLCILAVAVVLVAAVAVVAVYAVRTGAPTRPRTAVAQPDRTPAAPGAAALPVLHTGRVPATPEALLELLTRLVRPTKTSNPAKASDGRLRVQLYLDDGRGPGMVRLGVTGSAEADPATVCSPGAGADADRICQMLPNGAQVTITNVPDNCAERISVAVRHSDGTTVTIDVASCLEFDGTTNPVGRTALTADQAVAIAADGRWGRSMDADLVEAGRRRYPQLRGTSLSGAGDTAPAPQPVAPTPVPVAASTGATQWEDANGDSADDYCRRIGRPDLRTGRVACTMSAISGFGPTVTSAVLDWGPAAGRDWEDFNGDNKVDYCRRLGAPAGLHGRLACTLSTGRAFAATVVSAPVDLGADIAVAWDDANGDNKADYCRRLSARTGAVGRVACTPSTGSGFGRTFTSAELDLGLDTGWEWEDVNGDDKSDYCRRLSAPRGTTGRIACTPSTGSGFGPTFASPELDLGSDVGYDWEDVNGDDKADYCRRLTVRGAAVGRVACTLSTGTAFGQTLVSGELDLGSDVGVSWEDANSDTRTDYCRRVGQEPANTHVACTLATGTGFGATISSAILSWGQDIGVRWVDLNADKKKDYCRRTGARPAGRLSCTLSTGTGFGETIQSAVLDWGLDD